jgi:hypothetical protein
MRLRSTPPLTPVSRMYSALPEMQPSLRLEKSENRDPVPACALERLTLGICLPRIAPTRIPRARCRSSCARCHRFCGCYWCSQLGCKRCDGHWCSVAHTYRRIASGSSAVPSNAYSQRKCGEPSLKPSFSPYHPCLTLLPVPQKRIKDIDNRYRRKLEAWKRQRARIHWEIARSYLGMYAKEGFGKADLWRATRISFPRGVRAVLWPPCKNCFHITLLCVAQTRYYFHEALRKPQWFPPNLGYNHELIPWVNQEGARVTKRGDRTAQAPQWHQLKPSPPPSQPIWTPRATDPRGHHRTFPRAPSASDLRHRRNPVLAAAIKPLKNAVSILEYDSS